ncbi:MAG: DUF1598 domain-containing protein [Planctomycetaceae bacterium]
MTNWFFDCHHGVAFRRAEVSTRTDQRRLIRQVLWLAAILSVWPTSFVCAQNQGQQGQQGQFPGGIMISPDGVIDAAAAQQINPALEQKRLQAVAKQQLSADMTRRSELRRVSLVRLEQEIQKDLDEERPVRFELTCLAGMTQLHYIFVVPEENDLVLAGPAEGFAALPDGRVVGVESGRPVLRLDDMLTMLRLKSTAAQLGCSFDPDPDRLAKAQAWNRANSSPASVGVARQRFFQMAKVLGNWEITVFGLPASGHSAITTIEADYVLKRLALGLDEPRIRGFLSHLDVAQPGENTMRRWWFAPRYHSIERSADSLTFRLDGPRLQLLSQDELIDLQGNRSDAAFREVSTERYTKNFNKHIDELCRQIPAFAGVQNLFDLAVTAALIRKFDLLHKISWKAELLLDESRLPLQQYSVPTEVPSLVNVKNTNRSLLIGLIGGGVTVVPDEVIRRTGELTVPEPPHRVRPSTDMRSWWWD